MREQTHWVHVSAREIVSFQSAATGRLTAAFGGAAEAADAEAVGDTLARPERLAVHLNAAHLAGDAAALLGHLIGAELAAMRRLLAGPVRTIVGAAEPYGAALAAQGVQADDVTRAQAWRGGLAALGRAWNLSD